MLKNSIKVLFGNLTTSWKVLLYKIIVLICVLGLTTVIIVPIISLLIKEGFFAELFNVFNELTFNFNLEKLILGVKYIIVNFWNIIVLNNLQVFAMLIGILFVLLYYFVSGFYRLAVGECLNGYMGSFAKLSFTYSIVGNLKKSALYSLVRLITRLPSAVIIIVIGSLIFSSLSGMLSLATIVTISYFIIMFSLLKTLFAGYECAIIKQDAGVFEAFKKSFKLTKQRFLRTLSDNIIITLFSFLLIMLSIFFTLGVGLLVVLPLIYMLNLSYSFVLYYDSLGSRYYLDSNNIFTPKKLEEHDSFKKVQDII